MNGYERFLTAIRKHEPDKVPLWELIVDRPAIVFFTASSNSIHPGVNPYNYKAMVQATREYGTYPIDSNLIKEYKDKDYMKDYS